MRSGVHRVIGKCVRIFVELPADMLDRETGDQSDPASRALVQGTDVFVPDLVLASHLLDDQLRIGIDLQCSATPHGCELHGGNQCGVFGEVVGCAAEGPGVPLDKLQNALPAGARIVRTMPNTPALVGAGATAYFPAASVSEAEIQLTEAILEATGWCWRAPNEGLLDAVTGLSGSGPAYVFLILEAMADAGVRQGLPRDAAQALATRTVLGAAKLALETGTHPGQLKDQVTSPGGTTIAGLEQLEAHGVRAAFYDAVGAATDRSKALRDG